VFPEERPPAVILRNKQPPVVFPGEEDKDKPPAVILRNKPPIVFPGKDIPTRPTPQQLPIATVVTGEWAPVQKPGPTKQELQLPIATVVTNDRALRVDPPKTGLARTFAAICRRPQWLPLAVVLTAASILYVSLSDDDAEGYEDPGQKKKKNTEGWSIYGIQEAISKVERLCDCSSAGPDVAALELALSSLRSRLLLKYARGVEAKLAAACGAVVWELL
jgi:hypothetical protein